MRDRYSITPSDWGKSYTVARIHRGFLLFRTGRLSRVVFIFMVCGSLCGCAGRQNARQLSSAQIHGLELHKTYDQHIYEGYEKALNSQLKALAAVQREHLEGIRQKYLAKGCEELSAALEKDMAVMDKELGTAEKAARERINTILTTYSSHPSDDNFKKLVAAIDFFYGRSDSFSTHRTNRIAGQVKATTDELTAWHATVNTSVDAAIKDVDDTEAEASTVLLQASGQLQILRQHYEAILAGQEQIDQYLNQKTAVQLTLEGALRGFGIQMPNVNVDSVLDSLMGAAQQKMQGVADRLTAKLGEQRR